jgi:hypothetical protein
MLDLTKPICQACGSNYDPNTFNHADVLQDDHWPVPLITDADGQWPPCLREEA